MLERRARRRAVILEQQDVAKPPILLQVEHPLAERPQHPLNLRFRHRRQRLVVIGRLDDHFVRADAVHPIEQPLAFPIEVAFHLQRGKLVRHDSKIPAGRIRPAAVLTEREHLGRRHVLAAGAERTVFTPDDLSLFETEIVRALASIGGDDDPAAGDGIFAELRHSSVSDRQSAVGERERILVQLDCGRTSVQVNRHDVEAAWTPGQSVPDDIVEGGVGDPPPLDPRHGFARLAEVPIVPCLHFDEDNCLPVARNDVQFATAPPVATGKYCVPAAFQLTTGEIFADFTKENTAARHSVQGTSNHRAKSRTIRFNCHQCFIEDPDGGIGLLTREHQRR